MGCHLLDELFRYVSACALFLVNNLMVFDCSWRLDVFFGTEMMYGVDEQMMVHDDTDDDWRDFCSQ